jgi:hypothetical protein
VKKKDELFFRIVIKKKKKKIYVEKTYNRNFIDSLLFLMYTNVGYDKIIVRILFFIVLGFYH